MFRNKDSNRGKQVRNYSFSFLPLLAFSPLHLTLIIVLSVAIVLLTIYIIVLVVKFVKEDKNKKFDQENEKVLEETVKEVVAEEVIDEVLEEEQAEELAEEVEEEIVEEIIAEPVIEPVLEEKAEVTTEPEKRLNYSLKAHLALAPDESIERYLAIKSHLLSYPDIKVSNTWKFENFKYGARTMMKLTLQGKTMTLYFDLNPEQFEGTVYNVTNVGDKVNHRLTPTMFKVRGNRGIKHANELIDIYFSKLDVKQNEVKNLPNDIEKFTKEELLEAKLIKWN